LQGFLLLLVLYSVAFLSPFGIVEAIQRANEIHLCHGSHRGLDYTIIPLGCALVVVEGFRFRLSLLIAHCSIRQIVTLWYCAALGFSSKFGVCNASRPALGLSWLTRNPANPVKFDAFANAIFSRLYRHIPPPLLW